MTRMVLDTNVVISALFWKGAPRTVYDLGKAGRVKLLHSISMEQELIRVLSCSKFGLTAVEILPIINDLRKRVQLIEVTSSLCAIKGDPTDNIFLECAVDGKADYIISGDHHLLNMGSFRAISIITPRSFLEQVKV